jgi:hypothetical protein
VFPLWLEITMGIAIDEQENSLTFQPVSCIKWRVVLLIFRNSFGWRANCIWHCGL